MLVKEKKNFEKTYFASKKSNVAPKVAEKMINQNAVQLKIIPPAIDSVDAKGKERVTQKI